MKTHLHTLALFALLPSLAPAQSHLPPHMLEALEEWRDLYGPKWEIVYDETTTRSRMLFGGSLSAPYVPQTQAEEFALGRYFLDKAYDLFGVDDITLDDDRTILLPLGMVGGTDKLTVRFRQVVGGVAVHQGWVNVLLDPVDGSLLCIDSMAQPGLRYFDVSPTTDAATAQALAEAEFEAETGATADPIDPAVLKVLPLDVGGLATPELVWAVEVRGTDASGDEFAFRYSVAAKGTPSIVATVDLIHYLEPQQSGQPHGKVRAKVTSNGSCSDLSCSNPCCFIPDGPTVPGRVTVSLPHMTVRNAAGQATTTDAEGQFLLPLSFPFTFELKGPFVTVHSGQDPVFVQANYLGTVLLNPSPGELDVAQTNAFYRINQMRDWVRHVNPLDATMDSSSATSSEPYRARVNAAGFFLQCNAGYNGQEVVFSRALTQCPTNKAYSTAIWHEMGHWLNDRYGDQNNDDHTGFAEGAADVYALYQSDFHIVLNGFNQPGAGRNAETATEMWCGDCESDVSSPSCHGGSPHARGKVLMASMWRLRQNLEAVHGATLGRELSDALFLGWMNAFDQNRIHSIVQWQLLVLDDDDGDWTNGSPNLASIENAFTQQGFPPLADPSAGEHVTTVICP